METQWGQTLLSLEIWSIHWLQKPMTFSPPKFFFPSFLFLTLTKRSLLYTAQLLTLTSLLVPGALEQVSRNQPGTPLPGIDCPSRRLMLPAQSSTYGHVQKLWEDLGNRVMADRTGGQRGGWTPKQGTGGRP